MINLGKVICGLIDHSDKVNEDMGRITCSRCGEVLIDTWTQAIDPEFEKSLIFLTGGNREFHQHGYEQKMKELLAGAAG